MMRERDEIIRLCLTLPDVYEDYPFHDPNWTVMRRKDTRHGFAWIFERQGKIWVNLKMDPEWGNDFRAEYRSVIPAYHMNKQHWNSVILDGTVPDDCIASMIRESYRLCGKASKATQPLKKQK